MTGSLFDTNIPEGLRILEEVVTRDEEQSLIEFVDACDWQSDLVRRVIHFGVRYDYSGRVGQAGSAPPIPDQINWLVDRIRLIDGISQGSFAVIVNEYLPGQGISAHVDHLGWGPVVCSLSLLSRISMTFELEAERVDVELPARSLAVLAGPSRTEWNHSIASRKSDRVQGSRVQRERRVSFTFRTIGVGQ